MGRPLIKSAGAHVARDLRHAVGQFRVSTRRDRARKLKAPRVWRTADTPLSSSTDCIAGASLRIVLDEDTQDRFNPLVRANREIWRRFLLLLSTLIKCCVITRAYRNCFSFLFFLLL